MTRYPWCLDCSGTGMVPASGGEPAEDVTDGYVPCPSCGEDQYDEEGPCCRAVVTSGDSGCHEPGCYKEVTR